MARPIALLRRTAYTFLAVLLAIFLLIQFQQRRLRHRAERLHAEILALQLHPGTFADIQRLQKEWGGHAHYEGECTPHHCIYQIKLEDTFHEASMVWWRWQWRSPHPDWTDADDRIFKILHWASLAYRALGGRPSAVGADLRVHDNRMWGADFTLLVTTSPGVGRNDGQEYVVGATTSLDSRLLNIQADSPDFLRRGYSDVLVLNCAGCEYVGGTITAQTNPEIVRRFNRLNLSCLGPWHVCKHPPDIAPELSAQALLDTHLADKNEVTVDQELCALPISVLAREANDILLVQIVSAQLHTNPESHNNSDWPLEYQSAIGIVLSIVKNGRLTPVGTNLVFPLLGPEVLIANSGQTSRAKAGERYFLLYQEPSPQQPITREIQPCHAILATPENAAKVRDGIALDASAGEPWDWLNQQQEHYFP